MLALQRQENGKRKKGGGVKPLLQKKGSCEQSAFPEDGKALFVFWREKYYCVAGSVVRAK
jgi:hypothetical protein